MVFDNLGRIFRKSISRGRSKLKICRIEVPIIVSDPTKFEAKSLLVNEFSRPNRKFGWDAKCP